MLLRWYETIREIPVSDCVHYCGFRYGRNEFNPYENYIEGLAQGVPLTTLRNRFTDFIRYYRPKTLEEALGVRTSRPVPLWRLPWNSWLKLFQHQGWHESIDDVADILTNFSSQGVRLDRIREEFSWLERAWASIGRQGYQPQSHSYITVKELVYTEGSRFLVLDGNHRLSSLVALGQRQVLVKQAWWARVRRHRVNFWPLVVSRHIDRNDALAIFDAYIEGNHKPLRANEPAPILP